MLLHLFVRRWHTLDVAVWIYLGEGPLFGSLVHLSLLLRQEHIIVRGRGVYLAGITSLAFHSNLIISTVIFNDLN